MEAGDIRSKEERELFTRVIDPWRGILSLLAIRPDLHRVGLTTWQGMVWVNFFWVRASVVRQLVQPIVMQDYRFYYEHWLGAWNGTIIGIEQNDSRVLSPGATVVNSDGSVHLADDCAHAVGLFCSNSTHPQYYVIGQCVGFDQTLDFMAPQGGWRWDRRPNCECGKHECGLLMDFL